MIVLDHGYVRYVEHWGKGDAGVDEAGIIEAARQSTQGSFRGWLRLIRCTKCGKEWECENKPAVCNHNGCTNSPTIEVHSGDQKLLRFLFSGKPQHATPFEFCGLIIEVQAPIFVFREWHRHRTQSYNEMSARYAPLPDLNYTPSVERLMINGGKNRQAGAATGAAELTEGSAIAFRQDLLYHYKVQQEAYERALSTGVPKELARIGLPVGRYSRMRSSANLRNWLAFMTLRADPAAQWEIQQYAHAVGTLLAQYFPRTWALYVEGKA